MTPESLSIDPAALANVASMLTTHLIAFLLREGRLTPTEVQEIFQETRTRYTNTLGARPSDRWEAQTTAILSMLHNDAVQFGQRR